MSIWRMLKATEQIKDRPDPDEPTGKLGFGLDEKIKLDAAEDMSAVRALIHVLQDEPDKARALVRAMSSRDRAVLSFDLTELSRLVSEEEDFRTMEDRRKARLSREDKSPEDIVQGHLKDI